MSDIAKMDIFFLITSLAVIVVTVLMIVALVFVIRILRNVDHVSRVISNEGDAIRDDIAAFRHSVYAEGFKFVNLFSLFRSQARRFGGKSSRKRDD